MLNIQNFVDSGAGIQPSESVQTFYVQSNCQWNSDGSITVLTDPALIGDDRSISAGDITRPFRSLGGIYDAYALDSTMQGKRVIVKLLGDSRELVSGDVDYGDTITALGRVYFTRKVMIGYGDAWRGNWSYRGPRNMWHRTAAMTVSSVTDRGDGTIKVTTTPGATGHATYFVRWLVNPASYTSGVQAPKELYFPMPVIDYDAGHSVLPGGYKQIFDSAPTGMRGNIYGATPAVLIHTDGGDLKFRGVHVVGWGASREGDRAGSEAGNNNFDVNPWPGVERCTIGRSFWHVLGSLDIHHCRFSDNATFKGGEYRYMGCISEGNINYEAQARHRNWDAQRLVQLEPGGRLIKGNTANAMDSHYWETGADGWDPVVPAAQYGVDLAVSYNGEPSPTNGGVLTIQNGGRMHIMNGLTVRNPATDVCVNVEGNNSFLYLDRFAKLALKARTSGGTCIWTRGGAKTIINYKSMVDSGNTAYWQMTTATDPLRVGIGANINLATFATVADRNYLFTRRHEVNANGFPTDDDSLILDWTRMPSGYISVP